MIRVANTRKKITHLNVLADILGKEPLKLL